MITTIIMEETSMFFFWSIRVSQCILLELLLRGFCGRVASCRYDEEPPEPEVEVRLSYSRAIHMNFHILNLFKANFCASGKLLHDFAMSNLNFCRWCNFRRMLNLKKRKMETLENSKTQILMLSRRGPNLQVINREKLQNIWQNMKGPGCSALEPCKSG